MQKGSFSPFSKREQLPKEGKAKPESQFKKGHKNKKKGAASKIKATFRNRNAHSVYILAYVDDCVVTGGSSGAIEAVIDRIKTDYKVDDLGELHHFLGMEVIRDRPRRTLEININRYIQDVLERFAMSNANERRARCELPAYGGGRPRRVAPDAVRLCRPAQAEWRAPSAVSLASHSGSGAPEPGRGGGCLVAGQTD